MTGFQTQTMVAKGRPGDVVDICNAWEDSGWEVKLICPSGVPGETFLVFEREIDDEVTVR